MANMIISNLNVTSEKNEESVNSLLNFESKGSRDIILTDTSGVYPEYIKEKLVNGKTVSYITESLDMEKFIPHPEWNQIDLDTMKKWYKDNYGGPSYIFDSIITDRNIDSSLEESSFITYRYETKWTPNTLFIENVSKMFPTLTFQYEYHEDLGHFKGMVIYKNGECLDENYDEPHEDDPYEESFLEFTSESDYIDFVEEIESGKSKYTVEEYHIFCSVEGSERKVDFSLPDWIQKEDQKDMNYGVFYHPKDNSIYDVKRLFIIENPKRRIQEYYSGGIFHEQFVQEIVN